MAVTSQCTLASVTSTTCSPVPIRKYSAPSGPYQSAISNSAHACSHGSGSLLPMPPNYHEGSCWTLASLSSLNPSPLEIRSRKISIEVTKISLRMDGRWAQEKPYIIEKTWDEWLDIREKIVQRYPETESVLPKLSKTHGFLESIFTNSKRSNNAQSLNVKELNNFLSRLVTKCSNKVINSSIVQNFFQTEEMRAGLFQVQYTDDDLPPLRRAGPTNADVSERDEVTSIASHLQAFRFPEPTAVQSHVPSDAILQPPCANLVPWQQTSPPIGCEDPVSLRLMYEPKTATNFAHHTVPVPIHSIPPHVLGSTPIAARKSPPVPPKSQRRPHTSAENRKGLISNTLTLKVTHPESKTNIILPIQRGVCSLHQIKSKIQNKMKLAADFDLDPDWKIKLITIDQEEFVRREEFGNWNLNYNFEDDGLKLVEIVNGQSKDSTIKKITLKIC